MANLVGSAMEESSRTNATVTHKSSSMKAQARLIDTGLYIVLTLMALVWNNVERLHPRLAAVCRATTVVGLLYRFF